MKKSLLTFLALTSLLLSACGWDDKLKEPEEDKAGEETGVKTEPTAEKTENDSEKPAEETTGETKTEPAKTELEKTEPAKTEPEKADAAPAETAPVETAPTTSESTVNRISVSGSEYSFAPRSITLTKGEKVALTFTNTGSFSHNWVIEGLGIGTDVIGAGESTTLNFDAPASGTYSLACTIAGHKEAGMTGSLTVTE